MRTPLEYLRLLQSLLPRGRAWNREEGSTLTEVLYGKADELSRVDSRSEDLLQERDTRYASELLTDHETDLGLPDDCEQLGETIQERRNIAHTQLITLGGQDKAYFITLAAALGFTIAITEYTPFWCGLGASGSACGDQSNIFYWDVIISVDIAPEIYFICGSSQCGDPLIKTSVYDGLICRLTKLKPAHTEVRFEFDGAAFDTGFDTGFKSLPSESESYLEGGFTQGFSLGFDVRLGGGFDKGFAPGFDQSA